MSLLTIIITPKNDILGKNNERAMKRTLIKRKHRSGRQGGR